MKIELVKITEEDFKNLNNPVLFEDRVFDRVFGIISNGRKKYKIGWQSTDIKPIITLINNTLCAIGVDLTFVIFDINKGKVLLKLHLNYFFYDIKIYNEFLYVLTEFEVIKINITILIVSGRYELPNYFKSIKLKEEIIEIKCIEDELINIV